MRKINDPFDIWLIGNTGLRNPRRIAEGFRVFANSQYVGNLSSREQQIGFMQLLDSSGIINNQPGKDSSGSHARKWRLMFAKHGFIYPSVAKADQDKLGPEYTITPFGNFLLQTTSLEEEQELFLRAMTVPQFTTQDKAGLFAPLRWVLSVMQSLKQETGSSLISRIEFALWVQTTDPSFSVAEVTHEILSLRSRRTQASAKRRFDRQEIQKRAELYGKKPENLRDYADMNLRYLRNSGLFLRQGQGIIFNPTKEIVIEKLANAEICKAPRLEQLQILCQGAELPTDSLPTALAVLKNLKKLAADAGVVEEFIDLDTSSPAAVNVAIRKLENILDAQKEADYAREQPLYSKEIAAYLRLIASGGGKLQLAGDYEIEDDYEIEVPKDELPAYLEWILWRLLLTLQNLVTPASEIRGFKIDRDFLPVSTAGGGRADLSAEFSECVLVVEVTLSRSSRQEAMEGEPVRRHVADIKHRFEKPVFGIFIAPKVDTNTVETFRHGVWYDQNDQRLDLQILPLNLSQLYELYSCMSGSGNLTAGVLAELVSNCNKSRPVTEAVKWRAEIGREVTSMISLLNDPDCIQEITPPLLSPGAIVSHKKLGNGHLVGLTLSFTSEETLFVEVPFATEVPDELTLHIQGPECIAHEKYGAGQIVGATVHFNGEVKQFLYPQDFSNGDLELS